MLNVIRRRLTYANVMATVAVFIALGGSAFAAITITGKNVKNSSLTGRDVKNDSLTGADAKNLGSKDIANDSLMAVDFKQGQLRPGPKGSTGARGPAGTPGAPGTDGTFPVGDLPSGKTLRGTWGLTDQNGGDTSQQMFVSFGFRLASLPTQHYVTSSTPECPGTASGPEATAGHLCVYQSDASNATGCILEPIDHTCGTAGAGGRYGFGVQGNRTSPGGYELHGTWAVTSP